ncbi:MAG: isoaspartyl peptidase/L-asparaginase family protein [Anaerolineae bacterium]
MTLALIVHGGAGDIPADEHLAHQAGCRAAVLAGFEVLRQGGSALDAIETAIVLMEDDPAFDAGTGSFLNQAGVVQLDAGVMDGATLQIGAVAAVERVQNPIKVVRRLLTDRYNVLVGRGAEAYAAQQGFAQIEPDALIVERERRRWREAMEKGPPATEEEFSSGEGSGTVGAVAIDRSGNIVAGTSTGGSRFKPVGRVGDSPLPGCGYFADSRLGGASATGFGESIMRVQLSRSAADYCALLHAPAAAETAIRMLRDRVQGLGGVILLDYAGRVGFAHNTPYMAHAYLNDEMSAPHVAIQA